MSEQLSPEEVEILKERFRATGCSVTDIGGRNFEIVGWDIFPLRTHVSVNPYYIELGTFVTAIGQGFLPHRLSKIHAFLNDINRAAKLAKFTLEGDKPDPEAGGWFIMASVRFVTGVAGGDYDPDALKNLVMLWFQDIAELIRADSASELRTMLQPKSNDAS
jgi:hypothetical protein